MFYSCYLFCTSKTSHIKYLSLLAILVWLPSFYSFKFGHYVEIVIKHNKHFIRKIYDDSDFHIAFLGLPMAKLKGTKRRQPN